MGSCDEHERVSMVSTLTIPVQPYSATFRDPTAHELYLALFRRASIPYAAMLQRWTTTGHLKDPYEEFMVKESKDINRGIIDMDYIDDYWERRYTVRLTPSAFLVNGDNLTP